MENLRGIVTIFSRETVTLTYSYLGSRAVLNLPNDTSL